GNDEGIPPRNHIAQHLDRKMGTWRRPSPQPSPKGRGSQAAPGRQLMPQQTPPRPMPKKKKIRVPRVVNGVEQMVEIEVDDVAGPGWGPNDKHALLNHRLTRVDGPL